MLADTEDTEAGLVGKLRRLDDLQQTKVRCFWSVGTDGQVAECVKADLPSLPTSP
jgi:hypothetical protein